MLSYQCRHKDDTWEIQVLKNGKVIHLFCCDECRLTLDDLSILEIIDSKMARGRGDED